VELLRVGLLKLIRRARAPWPVRTPVHLLTTSVLHPLHLYVPLDLRPLRSYRSPGSHEQAEEQQLLHDLTSLLSSFTSDSTSLTASSTAVRTGSLNSICISS
jgi:hypothetical protein